MANLSSTRIFGDSTVERSLYVKQRLGVGVGDSSAKLDVDGVLRVVPSDDKPLKVGSSGSINPTMSIGGNEITTRDSVLYLNNDVNNDVYIARGGGQVGIGNNSPSAKVDVSGGIEASGEIRNTGFELQTNSVIKAVNGTNFYLDLENGSSRFLFRSTSNNNLFTVEDGGDVGINTGGNPTGKFEVRGTQNDLIKRRTDDGTYFVNEWQGSGGSRLWHQGVHNTNDRYYIYDHTANNYRMKMQAGGDTIFENANIQINNHNQTTSVLVEHDDNGDEAIVNVRGEGQGTGRVFVGQSSTYGGGIEYNGDDSPSTTGAGSDYITLWRRNGGTDEWTARNKYNSNTWEFRGNINLRNNQLTRINRIDFDEGAFIDEGTADYGSLRIGGGADSGWDGLNIQGNDDWVLMADNDGEQAGFYNDDRQDWIWRSNGDEFEAFHNGDEKFHTYGSGLDMLNNNIRDVNNIDITNADINNLDIFSGIDMNNNSISRVNQVVYENTQDTSRKIRAGQNGGSSSQIRWVPFIDGGGGYQFGRDFSYDFNDSTWYFDSGLGINRSSRSYALDVSGTIRATSSGYFAGNVGIGTTSPSQKLDVEGAADLNGRLDMRNNNITNVNNIRVDNGSVIGINGGPEIEFEGNGIEIQGVERISFGQQTGDVDGFDANNRDIQNVRNLNTNNLDVTNTFTFNGREFVEKVSNNVGSGWYTIADNGPSGSGDRASARFILKETSGGEHQTVHFYASVHYGNAPHITVLSSGTFSGLPFTDIRIKNAGTYDGAMLQVYMPSNVGTVRAYMLDNVQSQGWTLQNWVSGDTISGLNETARVNLGKDGQSQSINASADIISESRIRGDRLRADTRADFFGTLDMNSNDIHNVRQIDGSNGNHRIRFDDNNSYIEFSDQSNNRRQIVTQDTYINEDGVWLGDHISNDDAHHPDHRDGVDFIDFDNDERSDHDGQDGRLFWDLSEGLYISSSNSRTGNTSVLQWSRSNVNPGSNISISYDGRGRPTISANTTNDGRYVLESGDTMSGTLTVDGNIVLPSGSSWIGNSNSQNDPNIEFEGNGIEITGGGVLFGGGSPPGGNGNVDINGRLNMLNNNINNVSTINMNNTDINNVDQVEINGAEGSAYQVRGGANTSYGISVRAAGGNPPDDHTIFAVESGGGATRFGVTQNNGGFFRDQLWVNAGGSTDNGEIFEGEINSASPSEIALRLDGGIGFNSSGTFGDSRIEATGGDISITSSSGSAINVGSTLSINGDNGIEFDFNFEQIQFRDIGGNAAIVFKDVFSDFPSNFQIENVLEAREATIFAYEQGGNINLGWAETDGSGNVQNRANSF